jgi:hypothetical protein
LAGREKGGEGRRREEKVGEGKGGEGRRREEKGGEGRRRAVEREE